MTNFRLGFSAIKTTCMVFLLLAALAACKKDSDPTPTGVEGSWQLTAINISPAFSGISDYLALYTLTGDTCPSQTTFIFKANNTLEITAPASCDATKGELTDLVGVDNSTTWKEENGKLVLTTGSLTQTVNLTVNATTMSLGMADLDLGDGQNHTVTFAFKRL